MGLPSPRNGGRGEITINNLLFQGRRKPDGPARVLLGVAFFHPEVFPDVVSL